MPNTLYLVGCTRKKHHKPARPAQLYTGSKFVAAREWLEANKLPWFIISAQHGVLSPRSRKHIKPYDLNVPDTSPFYRTTWKLGVSQALVAAKAREFDQVILLMTKPYADELAPTLEAIGIKALRPEVVSGGDPALLALCAAYVNE